MGVGMRVLFVTSEAAPFAKTGGLADISAALPIALVEHGIDIRVLMPAYPQALQHASAPVEVARFDNLLGCGETRLLETRFPNSNVPVWLVDCPGLYDRDGGPYQDTHGNEWADNALRFALLNHVAASIAKDAGSGWFPNLLHANDWHSGLLPLLTSRQMQAAPPTLFTIHNLAYQGLFGRENFERLELPNDCFGQMEFYGRISFLKAGIGAADAIATVSPTYASEILTPEYGCGLDGLLRTRAADITGILNGIDYGLWNPRTDPYLPCNYGVRSTGGKRACKIALQEEFGLTSDPDVPLLAFVSRLVHQKMPDVVLDALLAFIEEGMQFALVAEGDAQYQDRFLALAARNPGQVAVHIGYDEPLAHRLIAGADMLLHPSRFEPCGLVPIYAMHYGTIPVVRKCGGMTDTVIDASPQSIRTNAATGFCFDDPSVSQLIACVQRAFRVYRQPLAWRKLQATAMSRDFSWRQSAQVYARLYRSMVQVPPESVPFPNLGCARISA